MRNNDKVNQKYYPRFSFRLGDLAPAIARRAASETKAAGHPISHAKIIKRAVRAYLEGGDGLPYFDVTKMIDALHGLRLDLARVGGNLNQLSHQFNIHNQVDDDELAKAHADLRVEFRGVMATLKEIEVALYKRR